MPPTDSALVSQLVDAARADGPSADPVVGWLQTGQGGLDGVETGRALAAIEAAVRLGQSTGLSVVKNSARDKAVRKAAGAALHKLKAMGQSVIEVRAATTWGLAREEAPQLPPACFVSLPDTEGYVQFIALSTGTTETVVFGGAAGGAQGHKGVEHSHLTRSGRREILQDLRRDANLYELPFHVGLHFLEQLFAAGEPPHEWDHLLLHVDPGLIQTARLTDPLARQEQAPDADKLALCVPLFDGERSVVLLPDLDLVQRAVSESMAAATSEVELNDTTRLERLQVAIGAAATAAVTPAKRRSWATALNLVAWLAEAQGWEDLRAPARHTALALQAGWDGKDIPYVREGMQRMVEAQLQHLQARISAAARAQGVGADLAEQG